MKKRLTSLLLILGVITKVWAQPVSNRVTGVVMPSPDAAALGKFGDIPVGHFTGAASATIPIYTLTVGPLSLPIALQYHASGLRVGEPASWVGMGWALQAGGIISRTVQGTEDELSGGYLSQGSGLTLNSNCVVHTLYPNPGTAITPMANAQLDGEPDIFSFSVGGYNGKFYINASGTGVQIPKSDLKIEYTLDGSVSNVYRLKKFVITTPDGVKYLFGDIDDGNRAIDISRVNDSQFYSANNWKLKKIESPDAAYHISFTYAEEKFRYAMRARNGVFTSNGYRYNFLEYISQRLEKITPSTGRGEINFVKENSLREDLDNPLVGTRTTYALDYVEIKSGHDDFCKKFDFSYSYLQDNSAYNTGVSALDKRLKLTSVQEISCNNAITIPAYTPEYEVDASDANYYPTIVSAAIDHWGYFNGALNNKSFAYNIPFTEVNYNNGNQQVKTYQGGADREANEAKMKLGVLKKITYPTGGSSAFDYEAHTIYENRTTYTYVPVDFSFNGTNCTTYGTINSNSVSFSDASKIYYELNVSINQFCCVSGMFGNLSLFQQSNNSQINSSYTFYPNCGTSKTIRGKLSDIFPSIQNNTSYYFQFGLYHTEASLKFYTVTSTTVNANNPVGGLRIKKITNKDAVNDANNVVKEFSYENANIPAQSSGILYNKPLYGFVYYGSSSPCNADINSNIINHFWFDQSYVPLYSFEGYHLGYDNVKEYVNGAGYTQYRFLNDAPVIPVTFPYAPPRAGVKTGNRYSMAQRLGDGTAVAYSVNTEKTDADESSSGTIVKAFWMYGDGTPIAVWKAYPIVTRPFRWASVETYKDGLTLTSSYTYRTDQAHLLPIETQIAHPEGTQEKLTVQYPADANHTGLLGKYMIHTPLVQRRFISSVQVSGVKTNYQDFSSFPRVATLQSWNTTIPDWETEATFTTYDAYGNPTSVTHRGWQAETYTWDKDLLTQKTFQGFTWQYEYETNTRLLKKYTEPSALFTTYGYDALSRNTAINQYNGKALTTLGYTYGTGTSKITASTAYASGPTLTTEKEFDGLGRPTYSRKMGYGSGNQNVVSRVEYDNAGRLKRQYLPGFTTPGAYTGYVYEDSPLNRPTVVTPPAPLGSSSFVYGNDNNQWTQTTTNALTEYKKTWTDTRGRTRQTQVGKAALINTTHYEYDNRDNLQTVLPHGRLITDTDHIYSYTYNGRNLVTSKKLPEKTTISFNYDGRDLVSHLKDGIHPVVYTEYDVYGRPTKTGFVPNLTSTSISNTLTETFYKTTAGAGFGQPYKTTAALLNNNGAPTTDFIAREIITFDTYHRPTEFKSNHPLSLTDFGAITGQTAFNGLDQATSLATNVKVNATTYSTTQSHLYDHGARLKKRDFSFNNTTVTADEITSFDSFDNPLQTKIGGNLQTVDYSYLSNGFLDKINGGSANTGGLGLTDNGTPSLNSTDDLFAMDLDYLQNGNISEWKQQNRGFALQTYAYTYDGLQRIKTAGNGTHQETFDYRDPVGNFSDIVRSDLVKSGGNWTLQTVDNLSFTYATTKTNRISSIADASSNALGYVPNNGTYSYDANGSLTYDPSKGLTLTNNFLNLPSKFTKADGSRQEIIYDAGGHKWQEKTYDSQSNLLGQKTYLENMEFEGNELSLVHHPTGFIRKLNSANHLSGILNGDAQGKTITSTQKIGDGRYTATDQVTLLPGFEAIAKDAFLTKIGSVSAYQWQYVLKDHLGNQRALFTDKNGDGLLQQSTDENANEVLALRNYSAFGLELGGSNQNINYQNPYKYTGKEENSFTGYYDFGARWSDPTIGNRFLSLDEYAEKYYSVSPYAYVANNPILYTDSDGRDIGYSQASQTTDKKTGVTTITYDVNVSMAVMNSSSMSSKEYQKAVSSFINQLTKAVSGTFNAGDKTKIVFQAGNIDVRSVSSMSDVKTTDHLMVVVDDVTGKNAKGGEAGGLADMGGKIAYVEKGDASFTAGNRVHEFGHNIGLAHNWDSGYKDDDGATNYMGYGNVKNQMVGVQLNQSLLKYKFGELNKGQNYETLTKDYNTSDYTTQQMPMNYNVNRGGKIPRRLQN